MSSPTSTKFSLTSYYGSTIDNYHDSTINSYHGSTSTSSDNEPAFTPFSDLPLELRRKIWKKTLESRLVFWRPGGGKALAVFSVNKESRAETRPQYLLCNFSHLRHGQYSIFINFGIDTVYRHQNGLPNMVRQFNFPCTAIDITKKIEESIGTNLIKADIFWNVQPWIRYLKTLTIHLAAAAKSNVINPAQVQLQILLERPRPKAAGQTVWVKIKNECPELAELQILVGEYLDVGDGLEMLREVTIGDGEQRPHKVNRMMRVVRDAYDRYQDSGELLGLKLSFVQRVESRQATRAAAYARSHQQAYAPSDSVCDSLYETSAHGSAHNYAHSEPSSDDDPCTNTITHVWCLHNCSSPMCTAPRRDAGVARKEWDEAD